MHIKMERKTMDAAEAAQLLGLRERSLGAIRGYPELNPSRQPSILATRSSISCHDRWKLEALGLS